MANSDLKVRTKEYALSVIRLFAALPKRTESQILGRQLLRSGTSVGAQYREANRAKSNAEFISKIEGLLQELEETEYWLELLGESGFFLKDGLAAVGKETGELKGIFVSIVINTKAKSVVGTTSHAPACLKNVLITQRKFACQIRDISL